MKGEGGWGSRRDVIFVFSNLFLAATAAQEAHLSVFGVDGSVRKYVRNLV